MYAYRIRVLGKLKYIPWCIMAVRMSEKLDSVLNATLDIVDRNRTPCRYCHDTIWGL